MNKPTRTIQDEYDATRRRVARMSAWLTSPAAEALPEADWNARFTKYQDELAHLRRLGDLLRPPAVREEPAPASLAQEIEDVFAA